MSAANPLPKTSRLPEPKAHEPSMEEILLSIRRIIADDQALFASRDAFPAEASRAAEPDAQASDIAANGPRLDHAQESQESDRSMLGAASSAPGLERASAGGPGFASRALADDPRGVSDHHAKEAAKAAADPGVHAASAEAGAARAAIDVGAPPHLLSPATDASVASAFNALVASRFVRNTDAIAALTHEMLRPMLKAWLDDNLPALVERLVRAEIERVAQEG